MPKGPDYVRSTFDMQMEPYIQFSRLPIYLYIIAGGHSPKLVVQSQDHVLLWGLLRGWPKMPLPQCPSQTTVSGRIFVCYMSVSVIQTVCQVWGLQLASCP